MNNIFTICYSEEEANEVGHFIMSKGYEGVQNDSYRYCDTSIWFAFHEAERHHKGLHLCWCEWLSDGCVSYKEGTS